MLTPQLMLDMGRIAPPALIHHMTYEITAQPTTNEVSTHNGCSQWLSNLPYLEGYMNGTRPLVSWVYSQAAIHSRVSQPSDLHWLLWVNYYGVKGE